MKYLLIRIDETRMLQVKICFKCRTGFEAQKSQSFLIYSLYRGEFILIENYFLASIFIRVFDLCIHEQGARVLTDPFRHSLQRLIRSAIKPQERTLLCGLHEIVPFDFVRLSSVSSQYTYTLTAISISGPMNNGILVMDRF